jgi:hypothetical protein
MVITSPDLLFEMRGAIMEIVAGWQMNDIGGLAGGLHALFDNVGRLVFTLLIGKQRARGRRLLEPRILVGGGISFGLPSLLLALWPLGWSVPGAAGACGAGFVVGLLIGIACLSYSAAIDNERARVEEAAERAETLRATQEERTSFLVQQGVDRDLASRLVDLLGGGYTMDRALRCLQLIKKRCSSHADVKIRGFHLRAERIETTSLRTVMATL